MATSLNRYDQFEGLRIDRPEPGILCLVLDTPGKLNAVDTTKHADLADVWPVIRRYPDTNVVVVHGGHSVNGRYIGLWPIGQNY